MNRLPEMARPADEGDDWLVSFADLVSILLGFFVIMYSMSNPDKEKFTEVYNSMANIVGVEQVQQPVVIEKELATAQEDLVPLPVTKPDEILEEELPEEVIEAEVLSPTDEELSAAGELERLDYQIIFDQLSAYVAERKLAQLIKLALTDQGVEVTAQGELVFESGSIQLSQRAKRLVFRMGRVLNKMPYAVVVEGHTDDMPMNSSRFPSNWELSSVRSSAVVRALMIQGIAPARLTAVGYADTRAVVDVETIDNDEQLVQAREKNRRIVFMITRASRDILY